MMKIKLFFTVLLSVVLFSFQKLPNKNEPPQKVVLKAIKNDTLIKEIALQDNYNEFLREGTLIESKKQQGDLMLSFLIDKPKLFTFFSREIQTIPQEVYITPGDTLTFKLGENHSVIFEGKNSAHYNFIPKIRVSGMDYPIYIEKESIWEYKKKCEQIYKKRKAFLEEYIKNETVLTSFSEKMRDVLKFEYLYNLSNRFILPEAEVINHPEYLKEIHFKMFNKDDMLDYIPYKNTLLNYLFFLSCSDKRYECYTKERLTQQMNLINKNLSGTIKDYTITKTVLDYYEHMNPFIIGPLKNTIRASIPNMTVKFYSEGLGNVLKRLDKVNLQLPDKVKNAKVIDLNGNILTMGEVLKQQGVNVKVIDFWASWCGPCVKSIHESYSYREELEKDDKVKFLYLSVDTDPEKWKKKVAELKAYGMTKNQYLLDKSTKSDLEDFFSVFSIPNYVFLNLEDRLVLLNAPSPTQKELFEKAIYEVNRQK